MICLKLCCEKDFDADDAAEEWCDEHGFELLECRGNGYDDGYEQNNPYIVFHDRF